MPVDLGKQHFITIEQLIDRVVEALQNSKPFGLTRWADSSNWIMNHGREQVPALQYREGYMTRHHFPEYRACFLHGVAVADVLGVFCNDGWTTDVMDKLCPELDISGKPLVYAWANRQVNARRKWADEVLRKPWRVALVGNEMPAYRPWLEEHFPELEIVQCDTAQDWPDVFAAMGRFEETRPQLALLSAGWYTSALVGAARGAGAVAFSYGHVVGDHMAGAWLPNTDFPATDEGTAAYIERSKARKHVRPGATEAAMEEAR